MVYVLTAIHNLINLSYAVDENFDKIEAYEHELQEQRQRDDKNAENLTSFNTMDERRERIAELLWQSYSVATGRAA